MKKNFGATPQLADLTIDGSGNIVIPGAGYVDPHGSFWPLTGRLNQAEIQTVDFIIENFDTVKEGLEVC
jgi:hypothetical protein